MNAFRAIALVGAFRYYYVLCPREGLTTNVEKATKIAINVLKHHGPGGYRYRG